MSISCHNCNVSALGWCEKHAPRVIRKKWPLSSCGECGGVEPSRCAHCHSDARLDEMIALAMEAEA